MKILNFSVIQSKFGTDNVCQTFIRIDCPPDLHKKKQYFTQPLFGSKLVEQVVISQKMGQLKLF